MECLLKAETYYTEDNQGSFFEEVPIKMLLAVKMYSKTLSRENFIE